MSFDEQEYSKDDHDMHDACEEIKRLRAALEEAATSITQIMILRGTMQTAAELESKRADESQARADRAEAKLTAAEARIIELQSMDTKDSQENAALKDEISTLEAVNAGTVYVQGTVDAMREERDKAEAEVADLTAQLEAERMAHFKSVAVEQGALMAEFEKRKSAEKALAAAQEGLRHAAQFLDAVCETDTSVDRRKARDNAKSALAESYRLAALTPASGTAGKPAGKGE